MRGGFTGDMGFLADVYLSYGDKGKDILNMLAVYGEDIETPTTISNRRENLMYEYFCYPNYLRDRLDETFEEIKDTYAGFKSLEQFTDAIVRGVELRSQGRIRRGNNHLLSALKHIDLSGSLKKKDVIARLLPITSK